MYLCFLSFKTITQRLSLSSQQNFFDLILSHKSLYHILLVLSHTISSEPGLEVSAARFFQPILYQVRQNQFRRCLVWVERDGNPALPHPMLEIRWMSRRIASEDSSDNFPFASWSSGSVEMWRNGSVSPFAPASEFAERGDWVMILKCGWSVKIFSVQFFTLWYYNFSIKYVQSAL